MIRTTALLLAARAAFAPLAAAPAASPGIVTDVTPRGFSVVWTTDEPAAASLEIYTDAAGTNPVPAAVVTPHPAANDSGNVREAAEALGVMKVAVTGLEADTEYYYRSISTGRGGSGAATGPVRPARTADLPLRAEAAPALVPLANPVLRFDLYLPDGVTPAEGALLLVEIPGAAAPVSAFAGGGGLPAPTVLADLNNLYAADTGDTLAVRGGEPITLTLEFGTRGRESYPFHLPAGDSLAGTVDPSLTPSPDGPPVILPRRTSEGLAQVFLDFPVSAGLVYQMEFDDSLGPGPWQPAGPAFPAEGARALLYDNGPPVTDGHPDDASSRFYRLRDIGTAP